MNHHVVLLMVSLRADSPVSVAAPEATYLKGVDLPVAREPFHGNPYVPATAVIGSLRAHAQTTLTEEDLTSIFGGRDPEDPEKLRPSTLQALGTSITTPELGVVLRAQTAIDRYSGSARRGSLRTREALPTGSQVTLYLTVIGSPREPLDLIRGILTTWRPVLGGGRTTGQGRCHVEECRVRQLDLSSSRGLREWLELGGPGEWATDEWESWAIHAASGAKPLQFHYKLKGDMQIGTGDRRSEVATTQTLDDAPYVPGSSLKGAFRSRAEFILRTLGLRACASTGTPAQETSEALPDRCTHDPCLTCRIFGYSGSGEDDPGQRGCVTFDDARIENARLDKRTHVALDRITGGQAHGLLFTQEVVASGQLTVRIGVDDGELADVAEALLAAVALDIHDGYVGLGHGTARGMGTLQLRNTDERERLWQNWSTRIDAVRSAASPMGAKP